MRNMKIVVSLFFLSFFYFENFAYADTPTPTPYGHFHDGSSGDNPCDEGYWTNQQAGVSSYEIVCTPDAMSNHATPATPANNDGYALEQIDNLLFVDRGNNKELVFLAGAGEYYEIRDEGFFSDVHFNSICASVKSAGFNMVRIFLYSGLKDANDLAINLSEQIYPFNHSGQAPSREYKLHSYNADYFQRLINFIARAQDHDLYVMISFFDFSEDINESGWAKSAWNPLNNDHSNELNPIINLNWTWMTPTPTPSATITPIDYQTKQSVELGFFNIWRNPALRSSGLNYLGQTQRDFVMKVVRQTRDCPNVIYEIANEPKTDVVYWETIIPGGQAAYLVSEWHAEVADWIRHGYDDCYGFEDPEATPEPPNHMIAAVNPRHMKAITFTPIPFPTPIPTLAATATPFGLKNYILANTDINIYSEHNSYWGSAIRDYDSYPTQTPTAFPWNEDYTLDCDEIRDSFNTIGRQHHAMSIDHNKAVYKKVLLADTDGLHRGNIRGNNKRPFGRDFDYNLRRYANAAYCNHGCFNTKESLHWNLPDENYDHEVDCDDDSPACDCLGWDGDAKTQSGTVANCDDFYWESQSFLTSHPTVMGTPCVHSFDCFDENAGKAVSLNQALNSVPPEAGKTPTPIFRPFVNRAGQGPQVLTTADQYLPMQIVSTDVHFKSDGTYYEAEKLHGAVFYVPLTPTPEATGMAMAPYGGITIGARDNNFFELQLELPEDALNEGQVLYPIFILENPNVAECYSDCWPFLYVHKDPVTDYANGSTPTPIPTNYCAPSFHQIFQANKDHLLTFPLQVQDSHIRQACYEKSNTTNDNKPMVARAGYGFSNISGSEAGGIVEIDIELTNPNYSTHTYHSIEYGYYNGSNLEWHELCGSGAEHSSQISGGVQWLGFKIRFAWPMSSPLTLGIWLRGKFLNNQTPTPTYNQWPEVQVHAVASPLSYYIDSQADGFANGTEQYPFPEIQDALDVIKKNEDIGTLDSPINLYILPGDYEVGPYDTLVLGENTHLLGAEGTTIKLKNGVGQGSYIEAGFRSELRNLNIECGVFVNHSRVNINRCTFSDVTEVPAISLQGYHDLSVFNCLFVECDKAINVEDLGLLRIIDSNILGCKDGIKLEDEALGYISNCIFMDNQNSAFMETARCVEAIDDSHVDVGYCCFYDNDDNFEETGNGIVNVFDCIYSNPQFVNYATGDYHLIQDTVRNTYSAGSISSCVDAGKPHYFCEGTTSSTGERDSGRYDIGYHYLESDFVYNFPRFKADDGVSTDYLTEVAVYNPTQYTQKLIVACYDLDGDIQDLNGAQDGNLLEVDLPAGNTWYRTLVESCSPGDTECIEMPCTEGSLSVTSDGPLFGQYRIVEDDTTSGVNSWMFQMQRTDLADDDGGITTLSCDNWIGRFGGGTNTIETEIVIHNLGDAENYVYGSVYNTQGTPVPSDDFSALLDPRETRSFIFDASSTIDYGNLEVTADDPVTGELIYHCQNLSGYRRFSEGVIMVPSTLYSDMLTAPFVQIENYGTSYQNSFIALKNPNSSAVTVGISVFDDQGNSIYTPGTPTPTPVAIPAHGSWCLDSYSFPDWGCYSVEIDVAGSETLIGHHEVLLYNATNVDFSMAGCELDHHLAAPTRYCVPCCVNDTPVGGDYETTWIVIRNNNTASSVDVDLTINAFDGTPLDNTTVTVGARSLLAFTFGDSPALLDPGSEPRFVLTIESEDVISGWAERYRTDMYGDDMTYDANALHAW